MWDEEDSEFKVLQGLDNGTTTLSKLLEQCHGLTSDEYENQYAYSKLIFIITKVIFFMWIFELFVLAYLLHVKKLCLCVHDKLRVHHKYENRQKNLRHKEPITKPQNECCFITSMLSIDHYYCQNR